MLAVHISPPMDSVTVPEPVWNCQARLAGRKDLMEADYGESEPEWGSLDILEACGASDPDSNSGSGTAPTIGGPGGSVRMAEEFEERKPDPLLVGGMSGMAAVVCFLIGYGTAWAMSPDYEFGGNFLSDLGVMEGSLAFNAGVMSAGLIILPFTWGIWTGLREHIVGKLGSITCAVAGVFLFLVGLFPEHAEPAGIHYAVSVGFFASVCVTLILLIWPLLHTPPFRSVSAPVSIVILVLSIILIIPYGASPLMETIAVLEILVWGLVFSIQMILARS